ncbi:hypothetical protein D1007_14209 [Hordeum vulgare]|nr:hypothetical protein D1007_14209 [Hordeum vulgare]
MARPSSGLYVSCWGGLSRVPTPPSRSPPDQALDGLAAGVKKLSFGHTCGSTNCSKGMANRDWLADKGNAALEENPTVSAKQLRETLQKEYDIKLQYTDVWKGRARAKDQLEGEGEDKSISVNSLTPVHMRVPVIPPKST